MPTECYNYQIFYPVTSCFAEKGGMKLIFLNVNDLGEIAFGGCLRKVWDSQRDRIPPGRWGEGVWRGEGRQGGR